MNVSIQTAVEGFIVHVYQDVKGELPGVEANHVFANVTDLITFLTNTYTPATETTPAAAATE